MRSCSDPNSLSEAWESQYAALAGRAARLLPSATENILELGCGRGQFTIPLAAVSPNARILAVDRFQGSYAPTYGELLASLWRGHLSQRVAVKRGDGLRWLSRRRSRGFQSVVSSEFLPEVTAKEMSTFFRNCFRVLDPGGSTVHIFLSPIARSPQQQLVIEADSDPRWTRRSPQGWFSPPPRLALSALAEAGFTRIRSEIIPSGLRFTRAAALRQLRRWGVRAAFGRLLGIDRGFSSLELPDWVMLSGKRTS